MDNAVQLKSDGSMVPVRTIDDVIALATNNFQSAHTRRAYRSQLQLFRQHTIANDAPFVKATVQAYLQSLDAAGASTAKINQALAAIRVLAHEARVYGFLPKEHEEYIHEIKQWRETGTKIGNWLDLDQIEQLYQAADATTMIGLRDKVLLGLLFFCALRREEAANLEWPHVRWIQGRMVLDGFKGKGNKYRPIPVHDALDKFIIAWRAVLGNPDSGRVLRGVNRHGQLSSDSLNPSSVFRIVRGYATRMGLEFAPHDLRRTMATLLEDSGVPLQRITDFLGHSDPKTTARYLSRTANLKHPICDYIKLNAKQNSEETATNSELHCSDGAASRHPAQTTQNQGPASA